MSDGVPCLWMRGGTSKAAVFLASDLPAEPAARDAMLRDCMGSPDPRQIDGLGGGTPLTSKVAVLAPGDGEADVEYLFLQVAVDQPHVSDAQGCGNILAAIGPAALELGLVQPMAGRTRVRIRMVNTGEMAEAEVATPGGKLTYAGATRIDGVPRPHAAVSLWFADLAGSICGALLPTGRVQDPVAGYACTLIDNGMPCVILKAQDLGVVGEEPPEALEADRTLNAQIDVIRREAGALMGLGDVAAKSVPKLILVSSAHHGGLLTTRSWIPHRVHSSIGVFAAVTVATAAGLPGSTAYDLANAAPGEMQRVEHPSGATEVALAWARDGQVLRSGIVRTARKLMAGRVFPYESGRADQA